MRLTRNTFALVLAALFSLLPGLCFAGEGDNVRLNFTSGDKIYLIIAGAVGIIAIVVAFLLSKSLNAQSRGGEKMESVGDAIRAGAMAYLRKQISTMFIFVLIIAALLFGMHFQKDGTMVASFVAVSFVMGVGASYIAGYAGMSMAVNANTRTAAAALSSYALALRTAFRSGAVAGLVTVGMGLIGATIIFFAAGENAMKVLIGFGFGGSLAALFMRVGGGIFTKAADVGADLVGKVEAGIPEDDPRNPATIADNVGDNVGDCAGMAADVFESYEVTLVAAIILGAATAAIFDQTTWMKLILFALMARAVGIIASIVGILSVKGSDDVDSDPLMAIRKGFYSSATIAAVLTAVIAFFMMSGFGKDNGAAAGRQSITAQVIEAFRYGGLPVARVTSQQEGAQQLFDAIKASQARIATEKYKGDVKSVKPEDLKDEEYVKSLRLDGEDKKQQLQSMLAMKPESRPEAKPLDGFAPIDLNDKKNPVLSYAISKPAPDGAPQPKPEFQTVGEWLAKAKDLKLWQIKVTQTAPANGPTQAQTQTQIGNFGPMDEKTLDGLITKATSGNPNLKVEKMNGKDGKPITYDAQILANKKGDLAIGVNGFDIRDQVTPLGIDLTYYKMSPAEVTKAGEESQKNPQTAQPPTPERMQIVGATIVTAEWWRFMLCIVFGLLMAFAFEMLTDYYVSTHKKPVQDVAQVATTGPAPMIIQGFSYGLESSVFSVLAIVIALVAPLVIFPPAVYGGYILSFYGIALVGLGLLTTTGYILAMDTFGPISDNAQGVFEMSGAGHDPANAEASKGIQRLDAAGNTTKALTKGFAIATAVVAAVALFHSYVEAAMLTTTGMRIEVPHIFLGLLIGGAAPYLFSAFSINAVGRAAFDLINDVRRQFREHPGIMAGTEKPDYAACVSIVTAAAQKELLGPGVLAIFLPVAVAFGFGIGQPTTIVDGVTVNLAGAQALGGFLAGTILSGQLMAVTLANAGGLWDNSKKLIEDGLHGGKGTEAHKAGVVCDTVGDPFKDTAGPALNPLIKVMNLVALLLAPVIIVPMKAPVQVGVTLFAVAMLAFSFYWSKRGSVADRLQEAQNI